MQRNLWIDYLKSAVTVLVVAHHSALAYTTFASFNKDAYILSTHAIADGKRWPGLDVFVNYNDIFFMSLMFLIAGLFTTKSIDKKGTILFIRDKVYRLFLPFIFGGTLLMLLAYFPSFYIAHQSTDIGAYLKDFFTTESWPVGPPWFIWVLFVFNLLFAVSYRLTEKLIKRSGHWLIGLQQKPIFCFLLLFAITWVLYVPLSMYIGAGTWTGFGPFDFQLNRVLLYFGYFIIGALIGNTDFNHILFSPDSSLVKNWKLWAAISVLVFAGLTLLAQVLTAPAYYSIYVSSCTLTCIAFLTAFKKLIHAGNKYWDSLAKNAYLIYLIHFVFVIWIQFLMLGLELPAAAKFGVTFLLALSLSWAVAILLRRIKIINTYI